MEIVKASIRRLSDIVRDSDLESWIAKLRAAEASAAAEPEAKLYQFRISYRLSGKKSGIDTYDHRLAGLAGIIQSMEGEHHVATSTWDVSLHIRSAKKITEMLSPPLDASMDALRVVQVSESNRGSFGVDELEP